jgi:hypothetical protein
MPIWTTPLWRARRDDRNGHIFWQLWSLDAKDIKGTICYGMLTSASHCRTMSAQERTGGRHVAGGEWPPGARVPQPRAGGERLGGPRGTPQVATSSPAAGPHLQARARGRAHGQAARSPRGAAGLARDDAKRVCVQARAGVSPAGTRGKPRLAARTSVPGSPRSAPLFFRVLPRNAWFSAQPTGSPLVHPPRVWFSPGSLLHRLGEACPALFACELPWGGRVGPWNEGEVLHFSKSLPL